MCSASVSTPASAIRFVLGCLVLFWFVTPSSAQFKTIIDIPDDQPSIGGAIGSGTQLNVFAGGVVHSFFQAGASDGSSTNVEVNVYGGQVGLRFDANHCDVNIHGGEIGGSFDASFGSRINISGGEFGADFDANNSTLKITGGTFDGRLDVCFCSLRIFGGVFGEGFFVLPDTRVDMAGGSFGEDFRLFPESEVHLYGQGFTIDGAEIPGLIPGQPQEIADRDAAILAGILLDGTPFSFTLRDSFVPGQDYFASDSTVTVTILKQLLPGDVNRDGHVSLLDVAPLIDRLTAGEFQLEADINGDGSLTLRDIAPFIDLLSG